MQIPADYDICWTTYWCINCTSVAEHWRSHQTESQQEDWSSTAGSCFYWSCLLSLLHPCPSFPRALQRLHCRGNWNSSQLSQTDFSLHNCIIWPHFCTLAGFFFKAQSLDVKDAKSNTRKEGEEQICKTTGGSIEPICCCYCCCTRYDDNAQLLREIPWNVIVLQQENKPSQNNWLHKDWKVFTVWIYLFISNPPRHFVCLDQKGCGYEKIQRQDMNLLAKPSLNLWCREMPAMKKISCIILQ